MNNTEKKTLFFGNELKIFCRQRTKKKKFDWNRLKTFDVTKNNQIFSSLIPNGMPSFKRYTYFLLRKTKQPKKRIIIIKNKKKSEKAIATRDSQRKRIL